MPWAYLDDAFPDHPKVVQAGGDAAWLFVAALCWSRRHLTAGAIPKGLVGRLTDRSDPNELAARLVKVGLWGDKGDDYTIHDYDEWNGSEEAAREKRKARAAKAGASRWAGRRAGEPPSDARGTAQPSSSSAQAMLEHSSEQCSSITQAVPEHGPKQSSSIAQASPEPPPGPPTDAPAMLKHSSSNAQAVLKQCLSMPPSTAQAMPHAGGRASVPSLTKDLPSSSDLQEAQTTSDEMRSNGKERTGPPTAGDGARDEPDQATIAHIAATIGWDTPARRASLADVWRWGLALLDRRTLEDTLLGCTDANHPNYLRKAIRAQCAQVGVDAAAPTDDGTARAARDACDALAVRLLDERENAPGAKPDPDPEGWLAVTAASLWHTHRDTAQRLVADGLTGEALIDRLRHETRRIAAEPPGSQQNEAKQR